MATGHGKRRAEDLEIKTTTYHILKNNKTLGIPTIEYEELIQLVCTRLEELQLNYTTQRIAELIHELMNDDIIYRVTTENSVKLGVTR